MMGSHVRLLALAVVGAVAWMPSAVAATSSHQATGFRPAADGYVSKAAPRKSFGKARTLKVGSRPAARSYLRFKVRVPEGVETATLRVYVNSGRGTLQARSVAKRSWSERSLVYSRAPRVLNTVARTRLARGWRNLDVTSLVDQSGTLELALSATGTGTIASRESGARAPRLLVSGAPFLTAAGDISGCDSQGDSQTAALVTKITGAVAPLGDLAYETGSPAEFANCYDPTWGAFKARSHPAVGNHEYETPGAAGYYGYWGAAAGAPTQGWYSYDLGSWHVVVLNSNCGFVGGCQAGSPQETWLRADLAAHTAACTLAYWHHPAFSTGYVVGTTEVQPLFQALYDANADLVLVGHSHNYQRWLPLAPNGAPDSARGIREFVVGTGGESHPPVTPAVPTQQVANDDPFGVLRLTLRSKSYAWRFLPIAGKTFTDSGSQACH